MVCRHLQLNCSLFHVLRPREIVMQWTLTSSPTCRLGSRVCADIGEKSDITWAALMSGTFQAQRQKGVNVVCILLELCQGAAIRARGLAGKRTPWAACSVARKKVKPTGGMGGSEGWIQGRGIVISFLHAHQLRVRSRCWCKSNIHWLTRVGRENTTYKDGDFFFNFKAADVNDGRYWTKRCCWSEQIGFQTFSVSMSRWCFENRWVWQHKKGREAVPQLDDTTK